MKKQSPGFWRGVREEIGDLAYMSVETVKDIASAVEATPSAVASVARGTVKTRLR